MTKPDELELNQLVRTNDIIPGMNILMGDNMRFVGHTYHFVGDSGILQSVNVYAKGFDMADYDIENEEEEECNLMK